MLYIHNYCCSYSKNFRTMRIKVKLNDVEKEVEISPKKKHRNTYLDKVEELQIVSKSEGGDDMKHTRDFIEFEDELAIECSNLTKEEYEELDLEEQAKITKAVRTIVFPHAKGDPNLFF